jgi:hypothetical protein
VQQRDRIQKYLPARYVFLLLAGFVLVVLGIPEASAQESSSFQELPAHVQPGDEGRITEVSGVATDGKIVTLSASSLRLFVNGLQRDVSPNQVTDPALDEGFRRGWNIARHVL